MALPVGKRSQVNAALDGAQHLGDRVGPGGSIQQLGGSSSLQGGLRPLHYVLWFTPPLVGIGVAIGVDFIARGDVLLGLFYASFWILLIGGILGALGLPQYSDLHINDREISRSMFGRVWQKITWDNIEKIRIFRTPGSWQVRPGRTFAIHAINKARQFNRIPYVPRVVFVDKAENTDLLIATLNRNLLKHHIPVEDSTGGSGKVTRTQI